MSAPVWPCSDHTGHTNSRAVPRGHSVARQARLYAASASPGLVAEVLPYRLEVPPFQVAGEDLADVLDALIGYKADSESRRSLIFEHDVEWLAEKWDGPLVIKGIQTVEDCRRAANSGATAVMLSNHGGRQLESTPAPVDCISAVADALHDRLEIICDGGIRRGTHIVKALALGANACSIGRGYLYPLAAGGQAGVERGLELLKTEVERTMALLGCNSLTKLDRNYLNHRP